MSTTQATGTKTKTPANALLYRLAGLRRRVRILDGWQGVCALIALALGVGVAVGGLDYFVHLPSLIRAIALVGLLVGAALVANRFLIRPFTKPCDDLTLALRVEEEYPELNDSLASTVQFLNQSPEEQERLGGSEAMRQRTMAQTLDKAAAFDFSRILDRRGAAVFGVCALGILAAAAAVIYFNPVYSSIAFWRFVEPFGQHTWTTIAVAKQAPLELLEQGDEEKRWEKLDPKSGKKDRIAIGRPYFIRVNLTGQIPKTARIEIDGHIRTNKEVEVKPAADSKHSASFITAIDMTQQHQKFKFRIIANDGAFPPRTGAWHEVEVLPPPRLIDLDGLPSPQITIYPPAYTDLSPRKLDSGVKNVDVIAGSTVVLRAKADRPLEQAWVEYRPENALITPAAVLSLFGQTHPLQAVGQAAGGNAVWGRTPAKFEQDGSVFQITFIPAISGGYTLFLRDHDRLERAEPADLKINLDPLPLVRVLKPGASVTVVPTADIPFKFIVTDEQFAVRKVYLEYQRKNADGTPLDDKQTSVLYDAKFFGKAIPALSAKMSRAPLPVPDLRLRWQKLEFETVWSLRNEFVSGDIVHVEICAEDFCDIYGSREPGRSSPIVLRIISKSELMADVAKQLGELKGKIELANKIQKGAHETVKDTKAQDKIDPKVREAFVDKGMQPQREVQDRIDAIKREAAEIRQTLAGNRLKDTQEFRDATKIAGVTDSLSQHELQQIGPKLTDAHNDLSQGDKNAPKTKETLDQAAKLQQSVRTALDQLLKDLNPEAKIRDHANDLRDIISKQEENRKALDLLNNRKEELKNIENPKVREDAEKDIKNEIEQKAKEQEDLANRMEKLLAQMKTTQRDFEKEGDKTRAQQIKNAIDQAEPKQKEDKQKPKIEKEPAPKDPITSQMKQVAEELRNKNEIQQKTLNKQEQIEQNLDKMLRALEGRNDELVRQEMKDRKDIQQNLDKLSKKIEELRNEQKKLDMIMDKEERLKKKQELDQKMAQLQEEIAQTRRDLAKLNEQNPANKLNDAMEKLEKAANEMKQGENPDKNLQDARKDIDRAKQDLKEAQEELARELLIKIADQLEGLKMREVASLERSESLQTKIMKRQKWSDPFLQTIDGNIGVQKGIAEETDTFKDKLKEAKVFHSILERAKDSMDKAGDVMKDRRKLAQERLAEKFDDEEMKDEVEQHTQTVKHQKMAVDRLDRLLDALKEEINKKKTKPPPADEGNPPEGQPEEPQGGLKAQDGIPPTAQLKALLAEQIDLNKRTEDFAKANPDLKKLNEAQTRELRELSEEQQRIHELFQGLVAPPMQPMPMPEPKEGGKK